MTRKKGSHLSADFEAEIIKEYISGSSCRATGEKLGVNQVTVFNVLKRNNIPRRTRGGIYPLPMDEIVEKYHTNVSATSIAKEYNVTPHTITAILKLYNIPANLNYHNPNLKRDYFHTIDSYDKAYFLGFLITDGNVDDYNSTKIELQHRDHYILEVFAKYTGNSNKIRVVTRGHTTTSALAVKCPEWVTDLAQYSVTPRKLLTTSIPSLSPELMPHLLRGMIDGDGWITGRGVIGFCGQEHLVKQFHDLIVKLVGVTPHKITIKNKSHMGPQYHDVASVSWGLKDSEKIANYIYKDKHDCYLDRKFKKSRYSLA